MEKLCPLLLKSARTLLLRTAADFTRRAVRSSRFIRSAHFAGVLALGALLGSWISSGSALAMSEAESQTGLRIAASAAPRIEPVIPGPPLSFETNKGQFEASVRYLARAAGRNIFLTTDGMHIVLGGHVTAGEEGVLRIQFEKGAEQSDFVGLDRIAPVTNYFIGDLQVTDVPNYASVRQLDVYPGVDVIYYGSQGSLEYDFVVFPGTDVASIKLRLSGHDRATLNQDGDLTVVTAAGNVRLHKPVGYQDVDTNRVAVPIKFVLSGEHLQFEAGEFDPTRPLVIDPILSFSTYVTGSGENLAGGIAVDKNGNTFITGSTNSTDFPKVGPYQNSKKGSFDAFISKLAANGGSLIYSTYLGGRQGSTAGKGIAIDTAGNAYVTGTTTSASFPTTSGAYRTSIGANSGFVTKLNASGNALVYSSYVPGGESAAIAVDSAGSAYIAGTAYSGFTTTTGSYQSSPPSSKNAFAAKLNPSGSAMTYATYLGGSSGEQSAAAIAIDGGGHAYVSGSTSASDFPTANAYQSNLAGRLDAFLTKLNPNGSALLYSTYLGGSLDDVAYALAVDAQGNAHVAGTTYSSNFPVLRSFQNAKGYTGAGHESLNNGFITKINAAGNALVYSSYLGGAGCLGPGVYTCSLTFSSQDSVYGLALDAVGNAYLAGAARSLEFYQRDPIQAVQSPYGQATPFAAKVQDLPGANAFLAYSTALGRRESSNYESAAMGIGVDAIGNAYVVAHVRNYMEGVFPITPGAYQSSAAIASNVTKTAVFKLSPGKFTTSLSPSTFQPTTATPVTLVATVGSAVPGGVVTFANKGVALGSAPMIQGHAEFTTIFSAGIQQLTATYSGDNKVSAPLILSVSPAPLCN